MTSYGVFLDLMPRRELSDGVVCPPTYQLTHSLSMNSAAPLTHSLSMNSAAPLTHSLTQYEQCCPPHSFTYDEQRYMHA